MKSASVWMDNRIGSDITGRISVYLRIVQTHLKQADWREVDHSDWKVEETFLIVVIVPLKYDYQYPKGRLARQCSTGHRYK